MVGYYDDFCPKFVKKYAEVGKVLQGAFTAYVEEVRSGAFPEDDKHTYKIDAEQAALIEKMIEE